MKGEENANLKEKAQRFLDSDTAAATLTKIALAVIVVSAVPVIAGVAPNAVQLFCKHRQTSRFKPKQLHNAYQALRRNGYIEITRNRNGKTEVRLTAKGRKKLDEIEIDDLKINKPKKWDGKWRVLMFDLPIRYQKAREAFRFKIKDFGFRQIQKSVWVYPYPCEEELLFVGEFFGVTRYMEILTVDKLLREGELKKHFGC